MIESTFISKSAPILSILLTNAMRGTWYLSAWRQTVSVCGSTPLPPSNTATAPSSTRSERSTSIVKSTWPGVSMMLMRCETPACGPVVRRPEAVGRGRRDGDAALLLLDHVVHGRGALVHLADLVVDAGVVEDALGHRRLARIDVGHDPDVARSFEADIRGPRRSPGSMRASESFGRADARNPLRPVGSPPFGEPLASGEGVGVLECAARSGTRRYALCRAQPDPYVGSACISLVSSSSCESLGSDG